MRLFYLILKAKHNQIHVYYKFKKVNEIKYRQRKQKLDKKKKKQKIS